MSDLVIDLSHWNDVRSFIDVRESGVCGVIHKCTESGDYLDPTYASRREQAEAAGLLFGAYHFLRPGDMREQAQWFVLNAGSDTGLLFAADHEDADVSLNDLKDFLRIVHDLTGREPVLYSGSVIKDQLGNARDDELARYPLWLAHYTSAPSWPSKTWPEWWLWQYTDGGAVPGIIGNVDLDRFDGTPDELHREWMGGHREPDKIVTITIDVPPGVIVNVVQS